MRLLCGTGSCWDDPEKQYERIVDDPVRFREFLDQQLEATPELFPTEIKRGYRMKDLYPGFPR